MNASMASALERTGPRRIDTRARPYCFISYGLCVDRGNSVTLRIQWVPLRRRSSGAVGGQFCYAVGTAVKMEEEHG